MITFSHSKGASIRIQGNGQNIVVFPTGKEVGDITLLSVPEEVPTKETISWPGEYDVGGVAIRGIGQDEGKHVSYLIEVEDTRIALPASPLKEWSETDIERLGDIHVLVLPTTDGKIAQKLIDEIDPRMLVFVPDAEGNLDNDVLKQCGAAGKEHVSEYKLKGSLPAEGREVVVMAS